MEVKKISSSQLARKAQLPVKSVFDIFLEGGLIIQENQNWNLTEAGRHYGGEFKSSKQYGDYIVWPENILDDYHNENLLSSTKVGEYFGCSATKINKIMAELGWIEKGIKGWKIAPGGAERGGVEKEHYKSGIPFVQWPEAILKDSILNSTMSSLTKIPDLAPTQENEAKKDDFRTKFIPDYRTRDGHLVRSRAEVIIDDFLYISGIVHAYERRLPIEEDVYSDFYLPQGKVYIEFWGMEDNEKYAARKEEKLRIYQKYGYNLIELNDADIANLDDILPRKLLKFGISTE